MRILHILDHSVPVHSAYSHRTLSLLRQQRALGWHTIQLTGPAQGKVETEDRNRDEWHFFRTDPGGALSLPRHAGRMARRLAHVIKLTRPDILHAHPPVSNAIAALRAGRRAGLPVLVDMPGRPRGAGLRESLVRALERRAARAADAVVVDSLAMRSWLLAHGAEPGRIALVPPAVHLPPHAGAAAAGLDGATVIAYAGSFDAGAGTDLLLAALPALLEAHPQLQLVLSGSGPHEGRLRERAAQFGDAVIICGREQAAAVRDAADVLVFPEFGSASLALPSRPLDAMAHGSLVVASDTPMHRELVEHGRNGILFEAGSARALAEAVLGMLAEPECMRSLRARARAFAAQERSWEASARLYGRVYSRLLENGGR
ncbi:MAG: glycosyltransferase family 4 protein [Telluria sp.]